MLVCDNHPGAKALRIVTNTETGHQAFLCLACYGEENASGAEPPMPPVCDLCGENPTALWVLFTDTGYRQALCHACHVINGRVAWQLWDASQHEELDARAESILEQMTGNGGKKRGRSKRVAVDESHRDSEAVDAAPAPEPVAVGATAGAEEQTAPDAED